MKKYRIQLLFWLSAFCFITAQAANITQLRNQRYCEIILGAQNKGMLQADVYSTVGLNSCPAELWNKLDTTAIKTQTQALVVKLNGPRYWVIDGMQNSSLINTHIQVFQGIATRQAATLMLSWHDFLRDLKPYQLHEVMRQTTWVYQKNKPIYELIDPAKHIYIMQSYSVQKQNQNLADLATLETKLHLPKGWQFRTRTLTQDAYFSTINGKAIVIQDDFLNTYQLETPA